MGIGLGLCNCTDCVDLKPLNGFDVDVPARYWWQTGRVKVSFKNPVNLDPILGYPQFQLPATLAPGENLGPPPSETLPLPNCCVERFAGAGRETHVLYPYQYFSNRVPSRLSGYGPGGFTTARGCLENTCSSQIGSASTLHYPICDGCGPPFFDPLTKTISHGWGRLEYADVVSFQFWPPEIVDSAYPNAYVDEEDAWRRGRPRVEASFWNTPLCDESASGTAALYYGSVQYGLFTWLVEQEEAGQIWYEAGGSNCFRPDVQGEPIDIDVCLERSAQFPDFFTAANHAAAIAGAIRVRFVGWTGAAAGLNGWQVLPFWSFDYGTVRCGSCSSSFAIDTGTAAEAGIWHGSAYNYLLDGNGFSVTAVVMEGDDDLSQQYEVGKQGATAGPFCRAADFTESVFNFHHFGKLQWHVSVDDGRWIAIDGNTVAACYLKADTPFELQQTLGDLHTGGPLYDAIEFVELEE